MPQLRKNMLRQRYEIVEGGRVLGFADYRERADDVVELPHTEIEPGHEGQGLAGQLVRFALDDIRAHGQRVRPSCTYVAAWIERHPEYQALVQKNVDP